MKNSFGNQITLTLFGESHGEMIGAVLDGLAPGIRIDHELIKNRLELRRPHGSISTARTEADEYTIVSGEYGGYTTGTPLTLLIKNEAKNSADYSALADTPRPGHADLAATMKYHGFEDKRGGGHFSGRVTAALVAAGAIIGSALEKKGIYIGSHIKYLGGISDRDISCVREDIKKLNESLFPVLDPESSKQMTEKIEEAGREGDSIGGILETVVVGMPGGVGEPWFDSVESMLSHALFSIPGIKGVAFGIGFGVADMSGSEMNDPIATDGESICTLTNNNGGINGGITNGMPLVIKCAVKPTPSIYKKQKTVNLATGENTEIEIMGRHDPAIIHRARAVVDAMCAICLADLLATRYGTDYLGEN